MRNVKSLSVYCLRKSGVVFVILALFKVPDYTDFIDEPIDFGSIRRYLNNGKYDSVQSFTEDIFLVFTNCETYNPPKSTVARNGAKLKTFVKKRMKDLHLT